MRTMQANRRVSAIERRLRSEVWRAGGRGYRIHSALPGHPDFAFPGARLAVFVHGCFWHQCSACMLPKPKANREFWLAKLGRNVQRDAEAIEALRHLGWDTLTVWEHEIRADLKATAKRVLERLERAEAMRALQE